MKIEAGYDKVWQQGCRECNYLNFGCGHHEEKPNEATKLSLKAEARIEELEEALRQLQRQCAESLSDGMHIKIDELLDNK